MARVRLHALAASPRSALGRRLGAGGGPYRDLRALVGPFEPAVVEISGPTEALEKAGQGLPDGPAKAEAIAVRLRRAGVELEWGPPRAIDDMRALVRIQQARGASSVEVVRADPSLLNEMQVGAYFDAYWRRRVVRRALCSLGIPRSGTWVPTSVAVVVSDAAFWRGVRSAATDREWHRLARSSYVVFYYHRIAAELQAEQERLVVRPRTFERQLRLLRALGFRPLTPRELLAFHSDPETTIPGRRYVLSADDAFSDAVKALRRHGDQSPHVFACTSAVGARAWWAGDEPVASWDELRKLERAGGVVESHSRGHTPLPELDERALGAELAGSLDDLETHLSPRIPLLAYPHGRHDKRVRTAAIEAGYRAAFTTEPGRNGAGTDVYCLRRVGLKDWDGLVATTWKALTGELIPWFWERRRRLLRAAITSRRAARKHAPNAQH